MNDTTKRNLDLLGQIERGGSFFELIEFSLERTLPSGELITGIYGVNVAKVREVVHMPKINPLGSSIQGIAGIFELRGVPIPAINLCQVLGDQDAKISNEQQIIVTEFCNKRAGFIVSNTHRIRKVGWENVLPPSSDRNSCMSGMILIENNEFLFILDLEKILTNIEREQGYSRAMLTNPLAEGIDVGVPPCMKTGEFVHPTMGLASSEGNILLIDDSKLVLDNVGHALQQNGYRVLIAENGVEGIKRLHEVTEGQNRDFKRIDCIVSDIEMPLMDGLTMIKKIREQSQFQSLPILIHTSLSGKVSKTAAEDVGANDYIIKNDIRALLEKVAKLLQKRSGNRAS